MAGNRLLKSIPADTLFQPMMHRSDNFFANRYCMMCAAEKFDTIDGRKVIQYMLDSSLNDLPHPPSWVDGSGLSRYNLFTPRDFVTVLDKLLKNIRKNAFGHCSLPAAKARCATITRRFPTGCMPKRARSAAAWH